MSDEETPRGRLAIGAEGALPNLNVDRRGHRSRRVKTWRQTALRRQTVRPLATSPLRVLISSRLCTQVHVYISDLDASDLGAFVLWFHAFSNTGCSSTPRLSGRSTVRLVL